MTYVLRASARRDLREIARFMARDDPEGAISYVDAILDKIVNIADHPLHYAIREEWGPTVRMAMARSHRILFRVDGQQVVILRIYHASRDFDDFKASP